MTSPGSNGPECKDCKDNPNVTCRSCNCKVCGIKQDPDKQLLCDECDMAYHIYCLNPPLTSIPEDEDWSVGQNTFCLSAGSCLCSLCLKRARQFVSGIVRAVAMTRVRLCWLERNWEKARRNLRWLRLAPPARGTGARWVLKHIFSHHSDCAIL